MLIPFAASLMRLLRDSQLRCPQIELAHCATWLNSLLPFQSLFPKRWIESSVPKLKISYTMGHWGQGLWPGRSTGGSGRSSYW